MNSPQHENLRAFIKSLLINKASGVTSFSDDQSLILSGRLDSLSVTKMILFLEDNYQMDLSQYIQSTADLDSFAKIVALIGKFKNEE